MGGGWGWSGSGGMDPRGETSCKELDGTRPRFARHAGAEIAVWGCICMCAHARAGGQHTLHAFVASSGSTIAGARGGRFLLSRRVTPHIPSSLSNITTPAPRSSLSVSRTIGTILFSSQQGCRPCRWPNRREPCWVRQKLLWQRVREASGGEWGVWWGAWCERWWEPRGVGSGVYDWWQLGRCARRRCDVQAALPSQAAKREVVADDRPAQ